MVKDCSNCKFEDESIESEPCFSCEDWNKWKPEIVKDCDNCKYAERDAEDPPCVECSHNEINHYEDLWKPKESTPKGKIYKALDHAIDAIEDLREQLEADDED